MFMYETSHQRHKIKASARMTTRATRPDVRECLFHDEKQLKFSPEYSEPNCVLECSWIVGSETCGCVPWFLMDYFPEHNMCEIYGNRCFRKVVNYRYDGVHATKHCREECPKDCNAVTYGDLEW